jgi:hypothetical protein
MESGDLTRPRSYEERVPGVLDRVRPYSRLTGRHQLIAMEEDSAVRLTGVAPLVRI